jgi:flavin reductase (DIM6/NTAB) family NADH-FMN oxidoreductase RutF
MSIPQGDGTQSPLPIHKYFATTVALITSHSEERGSNVMACEWTMNVSWKPLRIMSVIDRNDLTNELIRARGEFGVNLCSDQQASLSNFVGNISGREIDKLASPLFSERVYPATRINVPMIRGCFLNAECVVEQTIEIGESTAFIGRALAVRINRKLRPLLYHQGMYFHLGEQIAKPKAVEADTLSW